MNDRMAADAERALEYTFPVFEMGCPRWKALYDTSSPDHTGPNRFRHQEELATAQFRPVTTPNNDTLYSFAWLALDAGPVRLTLPATGGRYLRVACLGARNFGQLGLEALGGLDDAGRRRAGRAGAHRRGRPAGLPGAPECPRGHDGARPYRLRVPAGGVPADGAIDFWLQRSAPADPAEHGNWLPTPEGEFRVVLRAYHPRAAMLDRSFRMPPVRALPRPR